MRTLFKPGPNLDVSTRNPTEPSLAKCLLFLLTICWGTKRSQTQKLISGKIPIRDLFWKSPSFQSPCTLFCPILCPYLPPRNPQFHCFFSPHSISQRSLFLPMKNSSPHKKWEPSEADLDRSGLLKQHLNCTGSCFSF